MGETCRAHAGCLNIQSCTHGLPGCLLQAQSDVAAEHGMTLYKAVVRRLIHSSEGYECQEAEGSFMLVFHKPMRAVQFCLQVGSSN